MEAESLGKETKAHWKIHPARLARGAWHCANGRAGGRGLAGNHALGDWPGGAVFGPVGLWTQNVCGTMTHAQLESVTSSGKSGDPQSLSDQSTARETHPRRRGTAPRRAEYSKPLKSYVMLINEAIKSTPERRMILADIYDYFLAHYPYFRTTKTGWKNSIRHNLSLSSDFVKVPRDVALGSKRKGMYWALAEDLGKASAGRLPISRAGLAGSPYGILPGRIAAHYGEAGCGFQPRALPPLPGAFQGPAAEAAMLVYSQLAGGRPVLPVAPANESVPLVVDPMLLSNMSPFPHLSAPSGALQDGAGARDVWMVSGGAASPKMLVAQDPAHIGMPSSPRAAAEPNGAQWPHAADVPRLFEPGTSPVLFGSHAGLNI